MGPELAIAAVGISAGTQIFGSIMAGREQARSEAFRAQQLDQQQKQLQIRAAQEEATRRQSLTSNLQSVEAIRAGRGLGTSPTGVAALRAIRTDEARDIRTARLNTLLGADTSGRAASVARRSASTANLAGFIGAAGALGQNAAIGFSLLPSVPATPTPTEP